MMNKLKLIKLRHSLRSSYWFVPILMMALAMWLAIALPRLDQAGKSGPSAKLGLIRQINDAFLLGKQRTAHQDVEFSIKHLVEIAIRSLSPAVNDPFTAIGCIDLLCAALCRLAERDLPSPYVYDDDNNLRLIANPVTFAGLADDAFHQIRQYGRSDAAVTIRLLDAIKIIAEHTHNETSRMALLRHASMIERGSREGLPEELDRKDVQVRYQAVLRACKPG